MKQKRIMEWVLDVDVDVERTRVFYQNYHSLIPWLIAE